MLQSMPAAQAGKCGTHGFLAKIQFLAEAEGSSLMIDTDTMYFQNKYQDDNIVRKYIGKPSGNTDRFIKI
jgi:hypothetical protein